MSNKRGTDVVYTPNGFSFSAIHKNKIMSFAAGDNHVKSDVRECFLSLMDKLLYVFMT